MRCHSARQQFWQELSGTFCSVGARNGELQGGGGGGGRTWLNDRRTSVRLGVDQETSQVGWSFEGDQRLRKNLAQTGIGPENRLCLFQKAGEVRQPGSHVVTKGLMSSALRALALCAAALPPS